MYNAANSQQSSLTLTNTLQTKKFGNFLKYLRILLTRKLAHVVSTVLIAISRSRWLEHFISDTIGVKRKKNLGGCAVEVG